MDTAKSEEEWADDEHRAFRKEQRAGGCEDSLQVESSVLIKGTTIMGVIRGTAKISHPNGEEESQFVVSIREVDGKSQRGVMWNGFYLNRLVVPASMLEKV